MDTVSYYVLLFLVLDEPTAGLDPWERGRIRNFISEISKEKIVLIAKEILLLKDGSVISRGTHTKRRCRKMRQIHKDWYLCDGSYTSSGNCQQFCSTLFARL